MYIPSHFSESRIEILHDVIGQNPFGVLVGSGKGELDAHHLPFELKAKEGPLGTLYTHIARNNSFWQNLSDGEEVLTIFQAGDAYISPNWYPSKKEHHDQVPTWNYMVAHAYGRVTIREDRRYLQALVGRLTKIHEASQPKPWKMRELAAEVLERELQEIIGLEIEITNLKGKFKLGQHKQEYDRRGPGEALKARGEHVISTAMLSSLSEEMG